MIELSSQNSWAALRFGEVKVETDGAQHVFEAQVCLNDLNPKAGLLELDADDMMRSAAVRQEMKRVRKLAGASSGDVYGALFLQPGHQWTIRHE